MTRAKFALCAAAALAGLLAGCEKETPPPAQGTKVVVVASIFPIADLVRQIGGDRVEVRCLLDPGASPHGFSPKASHAEKFSGARLLVMVGMGLDDWARKAAQASGGELQTVVLTEDPDFRRVYEAEVGLSWRDANLARVAASTGPDSPARPADAHDDAHEEHEGEGGHRHAHAGPDPHVWLDPALARALAGTILEALVRADPVRAKDYTSDANTFLHELHRVDLEYRDRLAAAKTKSFLTYHAAFGHLARRYGLTQMAVDEIGEGATSPARLEAVRAFLKERKVRAIFVEPQFPREKLEALAKEAGAVVGTLDPEGNPGVPGYDSYLAMMRSNLKALAEGLGEGQ